MQLGPCHTQLGCTLPPAIPRSCAASHVGALMATELTGKVCCLAASVLRVAAAACSPPLLLAPVLPVDVLLLPPVTRAATSLLDPGLRVATVARARAMRARAASRRCCLLRCRRCCREVAAAPCAGCCTAAVPEAPCLKEETRTILCGDTEARAAASPPPHASRSRAPADPCASAVAADLHLD